MAAESSCGDTRGWHARASTGSRFHYCASLAPLILVFCLSHVRPFARDVVAFKMALLFEARHVEGPDLQLCVLLAKRLGNCRSDINTTSRLLPRIKPDMASVHQDSTTGGLDVLS
jgi:hypothetical protein